MELEQGFSSMEVLYIQQFHIDCVTLIDDNLETFFNWNETHGYFNLSFQELEGENNVVVVQRV